MNGYLWTIIIGCFVLALVASMIYSAQERRYAYVSPTATPRPLATSTPTPPPREYISSHLRRAIPVLEDMGYDFRTEIDEEVHGDKVFYGNNFGVEVKLVSKEVGFDLLLLSQDNEELVEETQAYCASISRCKWRDREAEMSAAADALGELLYPDEDICENPSHYIPPYYTPEDMQYLNDDLKAALQECWLNGK